MPTRLLDLGTRDEHLQKDLKLVDSNTITGASQTLLSYATLSHCWGPPELSVRPLRTTQNTLKKHQEGFAFRDLPKTFQDAVQLARALSIRFLWIDSLCIIQDNEEDWANESSQMAAYYENSLLTISAMSARDSSQGFNLDIASHIPPTWGHQHGALENDRKSPKILITSPSSLARYRDVQSAPLSERG